MGPLHGKDCVEICEALGLKHVRRIDLHMAIDSVVIAEVEYYPEKNGVLKLPAILKKFKLVPIEIGKAIEQPIIDLPNGTKLVEKTVIGDQWKSYQPKK